MFGRSGELEVISIDRVKLRIPKIPHYASKRVLIAITVRAVWIVERLGRKKWGRQDTQYGKKGPVPIRAKFTRRVSPL
jgi:hypothetical protein